MSKVLKRLYLGDVVKSFGTKQLRKLTTEEPQDDSIVGTWVFNKHLTYLIFGVNMQFISNGVEYSRMTTPIYKYYRELWYANSSTSVRCGRLTVNTDSTSTGNYFYDDKSAYQTITILSEPTKIESWSATVEQFISWLKANATKQ